MYFGSLSLGRGGGVIIIFFTAGFYLLRHSVSLYKNFSSTVMEPTIPSWHFLVLLLV